MRVSAFVLAICVALPASAEVQPGDRVALLGDSQAFLLARHLRALAEPACPFTSEALGGSDVRQWSRDLDPQWQRLRQFDPDVVLVMLGSNDSCEGSSVQLRVGPSAIAAMLRRLGRLRARELVWIGPPRIGRPGLLDRAAPGTELFLSQLRAVAPDLPVIDSRDMPLSMWSDALHPDAAGQAAWAAWIWSRVRGGTDDQYD
jgi:hypothetical protein